MKLVVVGGVAAGMSAAARARRLDETAEIVVLERGDHVSFANCGLPYHIGGAIRTREALLLQTPESLRGSLGLDVRIGHEVMSIDRAGKQVTIRELATNRSYAESYDKLVLCPGAVPLVPSLPGIGHSRVMVLRNVADMDRIKAAVDDGAKTAVVIGGGYIGVEMAESLHARGLTVDLVELQDQILPPLDREMAREMETHMQWKGVRLHLGVAAAAFRERADGGVDVELNNGKTLAADVVMLSAGVKPDSSLARLAVLSVGARGVIEVNDHLQTSDPDIYAAGDAVEVIDGVTGLPAQIPLAGPANRQGRRVADNLLGRPQACRITFGTSVVKVFDMTGGATGASERTLNKAGIAYRKIYLHPSGHAGYYPGTAPLHMKVLFAPDTGKLLGAQVVGYDGVDKRLDVLATALQAGLTIDQLQNLELAYAPPYGSAKDPVNMAGYIGANLLQGELELWYAEDFPDRTAQDVILDVRSAVEFQAWHIPGAINLPLGKLRASLDTLPRDRMIRVYCKVGFRSYLAYRVLKQRGFKACTLAGGTMTFCSWHGAGVCKGEPEPPVIPYAEEQTAPGARPAATGTVKELDVRGMQCPAPIRHLTGALRDMAPGDEVKVQASDRGFGADVKAWCLQHGHELVTVKTESAGVSVTIRKGQSGSTPPEGSATCSRTNKKTMVVFSGDLDRVLAAFIIANGAVSMGSEVTLFFTFWGLNALRKGGPQAAGKTLIDRMFGWMMPNGARALTLSKMHMLGAGTTMMKHVMQHKGVDSLPALMDQARKAGVKLVACTMSMDVMGIKQEELVDGVEFGGVAAFLGESTGADMTLFI